MGEALKVSAPTHFCFMFKFLVVKDIRRVLGRNCNRNSTIVVLNQWHPLFDASEEKIVLVSVLLRMHKLLPKRSTIFVFKNVGNRLGTFMDNDLSF